MFNTLTKSSVSAIAMLAVIFALAGSVNAQAKVQARAVVSPGRIFGVGRIVVPLDKKIAAAIGQGRLCNFEFVSSLRIGDTDKRVLYPVFADGDIVLVEDDELPEEISVDFLFRGDGPLTVTLTGASKRPITVKIKPTSDKNLHYQMLHNWWDSFAGRVEELSDADFYPPQFDNYVLAMLSRRLNLTMPRTTYAGLGRKDIDQMLGLLLGTESIRIAMQKRTILKKTRKVEKIDPALLNQLKGIEIPPINFPHIPPDVKVESIAMRVPAECFYLRCGSFDNFRWLRGTIDDWGGSMRNMAATRSVDYGISSNLERQLALKESILSKMLGSMLISDVAILGTDTFFREGASVGIMFQAKNNVLLKMQLKRLRQKVTQTNKSASLRTVSIGGRKVSLLSTDDNSVRSFYIADGDYHLVTTSRTVARRFLETGKGKSGKSLGASKEFRYARTKVPLNRGDTLFIYLSDAFFRNLTGPLYRIEMTRRMKAMSDIELVHLARLAAHAEGKKADSIKQLIAGEFLPDNFTARPDGSKCVIRNGQLVDSLRGCRGSMLPVCDVKITGVTKSEVWAYQSFSFMYQSQWRQMDPVIVAVKRRQDKGIENLALDIFITPYAKRHYEWLEQYLGKANNKRLETVFGDIASVEATLRNYKKDEKPHRVFAGLRDCPVSWTIKAGKVIPPDGWYEKIPWGYLGETTKKDILRLVSGRRVWKHCDKFGYCTSGTFWGRHKGDFYTWANCRPTLELVTPQLKIVNAKRKAQLRLRVDDLSKTHLAGILNASGYMHARKVSSGNSLLLQTIRQQFRIDDKRALREAERVLGARLVCPLGGRYIMIENQGGLWQSTAWKHNRITRITNIPKNFRFDFLDWFAGLKLEFTLNPAKDTLISRVQLRLRPKKQ